MSKVLVTGGAGFIGTAMVKRLLAEGFEVVCFDLPDQLLRNRLPQGIETYGGNILDAKTITSAVTGCDYVMHLSGALGVKNTENNRLVCLEVNIQGIKNLLEVCIKKQIKKVVFASSSEVYGEQVKQPISESNPLNAGSVYAVSKLAAEEYLKAYEKKYGLKYSIVRFFNVYGPGQRRDFVVSNFVRLVMNNEPPTIYSGGGQIRSFCHINDAVAGALLALNNSRANSEVFNIGNDEEPISIHDLAIKIMALSGKDMEVKFLSAKDSDRQKAREILRRIPDISKARAVLGYEPRISLSEGIMSIIRHGGSSVTG